jgi:hypothetical protein
VECEEDWEKREGERRKEKGERKEDDTGVGYEKEQDTQMRRRRGGMM